MKTNVERVNGRHVKALLQTVFALGMACFAAGCGTMRRAGIPQDFPLPPGMTRAEYDRHSREASRAEPVEVAVTKGPREVLIYRGEALLLDTPTPLGEGPARVALSDSSGLSPAVVSNFTVSLWMKCAAYPSTAQAYAGIIGKYAPGDPSTSEWLLGMDSAGKVFLETTGSGAGPRVTAVSAVSTGLWHHVCAEWRGDGNALLYVDGRLVRSGVLARPQSRGLALVVGDVVPVTGAHMLVGLVDEIKIWNKLSSETWATALYRDVPDRDADGIMDGDDPDDNNDGISDEWAYKYFGDPLGGAPAEDPDSDQFSNRAEYTAGTDPMDNRSYFRSWSVTTTNRPGRDLRVECDGVPGRCYRLLHAPRLSSTNWTAVGTETECTAMGPLFLTVPATNRMGFHRVSVRMK